MKQNPIAIFFLGVLTFALAPNAGALDAQSKFTAMKLRQYCNACHGLGELRFIYDGDDDALWKYIFSNNVPGKNKLWAQRITEVLDWSSDEPPPADQTQWMPRGIKRLDLAQDVQNGIPARRIMVETLKR